MSDERMIRVPLILAREIKVEAAQNGITMGEMVRKSFRAYLKQCRLNYQTTCGCGHEIWQKQNPEAGMSVFCDYCGKKVMIK